MHTRSHFPLTYWKIGYDCNDLCIQIDVNITCKISETWWRCKSPFFRFASAYISLGEILQFDFIPAAFVLIATCTSHHFTFQNHIEYILFAFLSLCVCVWFFFGWKMNWLYYIHDDVMAFSVWLVANTRMHPCMHTEVANPKIYTACVA